MAKITCVVSDGTRSVELVAPDVMEFDLSKFKQPYHVPAISNVFSSLIGQVSLAWADFENEFDLFLHGLVDATSTTVTPMTDFLITAVKLEYTRTSGDD